MGTALVNATTVTTVNGLVFNASAANVNNGTFGVTITGRPGHVYVIECSTNLVHWEPVSTNATLDGVIQFADPNAGSSVQRFYRAREQ